MAGSISSYWSRRLPIFLSFSFLTIFCSADVAHSASASLPCEYILHWWILGRYDVPVIIGIKLVDSHLVVSRSSQAAFAFSFANDISINTFFHGNLHYHPCRRRCYVHPYRVLEESLHESRKSDRLSSRR